MCHCMQVTVCVSLCMGDSVCVCHCALVTVCVSLWVGDCVCVTVRG